MAGEKLHRAKHAARLAVDRLAPSDIVSIVAYDSTVRVVVPATKAVDKASIHEAIERISPSGTTALFAGVSKGADELRKFFDRNRVNRIVLLSDGLANVGPSSAGELAQLGAALMREGMSVTTLGLGLDYNEDLMTRLADQGGGRYHFIKNGDAVAGILADEMKGLVATVARGLVLELAPAAGTGVAQVFGYATDRDGALTRARIGSIGAGQTREVIVRLALPALTPPRVDLGALTLRFMDVTADGIAREVAVPMAVDVTTDPAQVAASEHFDVSVRVAEVEAAEKLEVAARAADRGDFDGARGSLQVAIDGLKTQAAARPSPKLNKQIAELEEARDEVQQARSSAEGQKEYSKKFKARAYDNRKK
jgi:Ca-activated chloride channel family protein